MHNIILRQNSTGGPERLNASYLWDSGPLVLLGTKPAHRTNDGRQQNNQGTMYAAGAGTRAQQEASWVGGGGGAAIIGAAGERSRSWSSQTRRRGGAQGYVGSTGV